VNARQLKALDALIERGVSPDLAARLVLGSDEAVASQVAGPVASPKSGKPKDYVLHTVADLPCQHPTNPCSALLRSNGPRSRKHGPKGHRAVR
jgi:hypothetical protein